jgi:GNAT superfamily N-acetyltransferase
MKIRPVRKEDIAQIIELIGAVWAEYDCVLDAETEERALLAPDEYFHARRGEFWVVEEAGEIVATVAVTLNDPETAELKYLYVDKNKRGHGLGARLTGQAITFARAKGAGEMILWSDTRFTNAHRLYERLGFEKTVRRELDDLNNSIEYGFRMNI